MTAGTGLAEVIDLGVVRGAVDRAVPMVPTHEYQLDTVMTLAEIDAEVEAIRSELVRPLQRLARLRTAAAHLTAGFATWHEACEAWFGDLRSLRLQGSPEAVAERDALVWSMREAGVTTRPIRERLGISSYAVQEALRKGDPAPERVTGVDGSSRSSRGVRREALPAPEGRVFEQAAEWVRREPGLTLGGLAKAAGWSEGKASGALNRAMRAGLVVREPGKRGTVRGHFPVEDAS